MNIYSFRVLQKPTAPPKQRPSSSCPCGKPAERSRPSLMTQSSRARDLLCGIPEQTSRLPCSLNEKRRDKFLGLYNLKKSVIIKKLLSITLVVDLFSLKQVMPQRYQFGPVAQLGAQRVRFSATSIISYCFILLFWERKGFGFLPHL